MSKLFTEEFEFRTFDTDRFVQTANAHIDRVYTSGRKVGESFFHAVAAFLSDINIKQRNGGPFGAVIVEYEKGLDANGNGRGKPHVMGVGANHVVPNSDPSAHAEMEAYRDAARRKGSSDLGGTVLYTSCECCPMCLAVANGCGIKSISYNNTREQAAKIDFADKLQYDMFGLARREQMTYIEQLSQEKRRQLENKLGEHGAMVLDDKGNIFSYGDANVFNHPEDKDPTGIASINAIRAAVKKHAEAIHAITPGEAVFCLPEGFTLVCKDIPHPAGLITADWARMLRKRDPHHPFDPKYDDKIPDPSRIIHLSKEYEQLLHRSDTGVTYTQQDAELTYKQPALPDEKRAVRTKRYTGPVIQKEASQVFLAFQEGKSSGAQKAY